MLPRVLSFSSVQAIILYVFLLRIKCLSIKQIKTNRELRNAATFASVSTYTTTALPVGRLARETTPVSPLKLPVKSVHLFQMNSCKKSRTGNVILKKQKAATSSKDDELDLLGEGDGDSFTGSNADLESAADNLFTSPPPSSTSRLQFLVFKDPSQVCPSQVQLCKIKSRKTLRNPWVIP